MEELTAIANFIAGVDVNIPWHVTPFHPDFKMSDKPYDKIIDENNWKYVL